MKAGFLLLLLAVSAMAQSQSNPTLEDLRSEILAMKKDYEARIAALEKRLAEVEASSKKSEEQLATTQQRLTDTQRQTAATEQRVVSTEEEVKSAQDTAVQSAAAAASLQEQVDQLGTSPLIDSLPDTHQKLFEFKGYARSGFGVNSNGGAQVAFQAPGAGAKYRLGNEADTYTEFSLINNWVQDKTGDSPWFKTEIMISGSTQNLSSFDPTAQFLLRQAYAQGGNLFSGYFAPVTVWAGERYYHREDINTNDFFLIDMAGYGGGFEGLPLFGGKLAVAYLGAAEGTQVNDIGRRAQRYIDAHYTGLKFLGGDVSLWYAWAHGVMATTDEAANNHESGSSFGFSHMVKEFAGGYQKFTIQYGYGAGAVFSTTTSDPAYLQTHPSTLLITDHMLIEPNKKFAIMPTFVGRWMNANDIKTPQTWIAFGAQPVWYYHPHMSLAFDAGFDWVSNPQPGNPTKGWLRKFTIAQQFGAKPGFFSRPVVRVFLTYGNWSEDLVGYVGDAAFVHNKQGFTAGVQAETWW